MSAPLAYLLTWTCRGTWLHGDERGSADRQHNQFGTPWLAPDFARLEQERERLERQPGVLSPEDRRVATIAIEEHAALKRWFLHEHNVRTNHVHVVVSAPLSPERVMQQLKAWATRALAATGRHPPRDLWTRHGSTRYLYTREGLDGAIRYVRDGQ